MIAWDNVIPEVLAAATGAVLFVDGASVIDAVTPEARSASEKSDGVYIILKDIGNRINYYSTIFCSANIK